MYDTKIKSVYVEDTPEYYLRITSDGIVLATTTLKAMTADTPVDLVIPSEINGIKVTSIYNSAFYECKALTSVVISNGVINIDNGAFYGCTSLTSVVIPNSVTSIGMIAFEDCRSLTSININKPKDSIAGAPWDAPNATVNWLG